MNITGDIVVSDKEVSIHLRAIILQLGASDITKDYDSLADALLKMGMWDFLFNQARVVAHLQAFSTRDRFLINELMQERTNVRQLNESNT